MVPYFTAGGALFSPAPGMTTTDDFLYCESQMGRSIHPGSRAAGTQS